MTVRITGLNSGLDTESIISALVSSYQTKVDDKKKAQTKLSWTQDAWSSLNSKIYSLYTSVSSLRYSTAWNLKTTSVSDTSKASVSAGSDAISGTHSLKIKQLAKSGYITGAKIDSADSSASTLADLGYTGGTGKITVAMKDGTSTDIEVTGETKISEFVASLNKVGVSDSSSKATIAANYDATNKRIFVSATESGADNDFELTGSNEDGIAALTALGLNVDNKSSAVYSSYTAYAKYTTDSDGNSVYDETATKAYFIEVQKAAKAASENITIATGEQTAAQSQIDKANAYKTAYELVQANSSRDFDAEIAAAEEAGEDTAALTAEKEAYEAAVTTVSEYETDAASDSVKADIVAAVQGGDSDAFDSLIQAQQDIIDNQQTTIDTNQAVLDGYKNQGLYLYDDYSAITESDIEDGTLWTNDFKARLATAQSAQAGTLSNSTSGETGAVRVAAQDSIIYLDGAKFTSNTNSYAINGLTIKATGVTGDDNEISITTSNDAQGMYDKIKDMLQQYNEVINEMMSLYNADSSSGYEPLTDDEKAEMSDTEIEKWETKIKDSLLRHDSTLSTLINTMVNSMNQAYEVDGEKVSLGTFGIQTLGYLNAEENENYAYHIDGDSDDSSSSGKTDKLLAALQTDPDKVAEFMEKLTSGLYTNLDKKMKSTTLSSVYKIYNDKEMASEYSDYTTQISTWNTRLSDLEDYYYDKFSTMESSLANLNSQSSSLTSMLG